MSTVDKPSCYNRPDFLRGFYAPDGYFNDGGRRLRLVPHRMSTTCKQWGPLGEAKIHGWNCTGCRHKPTEDKCTLCDSTSDNCSYPDKEGCLRVQRLKEV